ncbi:MAG TPA: hypothetical protein VFX88_16785 [Actinomycetota bacterium]|jgi:hypothetical protein|nr:hypothetical protein [Actinomycetota bacterium]
MEHAKVNGVELEYEVVGSGEAMLLILTLIFPMPPRWPAPSVKPTTRVRR